ncbi:hypothetical protein MMC28_006401, partial [Mycoblastus sanguinarius]|nr:hypothetical protein [Mycoblastus sanguinarius]
MEKHNVKTNTSNEDRRNKAISQMLGDQAWESRRASQYLYHKSDLQEEGSVELELSLLRQESENGAPRPLVAGIPQHLCHCITVPQDTLSIVNSRGTERSQSSQLELHVEKNLEVQEEPLAYTDTLKEAFRELLEKESCLLRESVGDEVPNAQPKSFKVWKSADPLERSGWSDLKLMDQLHSKATKARPEDLSLRERVQ